LYIRPIDGHQSDQLLVNGATDGLLINLQRTSQDYCQPLDFGIKLLLPQLVAFLLLGDKELPVVIKGSIRCDIKRSPRPPAMNHQHAAWRNSVSHPKLVEYVGVQDGNVCQNHASCDQLKIHVRPYVPSPSFFVSSKGRAAGFTQCGLDQQVIDLIETYVDGRFRRCVVSGRCRTLGFLDSEWHHDKNMRLHNIPPSEPLDSSLENPLLPSVKFGG
jgi:hypothetical protein